MLYLHQLLWCVYGDVVLCIVCAELHELRVAYGTRWLSTGRCRSTVEWLKCHVSACQSHPVEPSLSSASVAAGKTRSIESINTSLNTMSVIVIYGSREPVYFYIVSNFEKLTRITVAVHIPCPFMYFGLSFKFLDCWKISVFLPTFLWHVTEMFHVYIIWLAESLSLQFLVAKQLHTVERALLKTFSYVPSVQLFSLLMKGLKVTMQHDKIIFWQHC